MTKEETLHRGVCDYIRLQYPNILFNSDMSGIKLPVGLAVKASKLRSGSGFPDLVIYAQRGGYGALFIELKAEGVKITKKDGTLKTPHLEKQQGIINELIFNDYAAVFTIGFDSAKGVIDAYLNL